MITRAFTQYLISTKSVAKRGTCIKLTNVRVTLELYRCYFDLTC